MRKMLSFTFGVLVGTIVATAWANYPNYPDRWTRPPQQPRR